jgi:hypothetical protein
VTKPPKIGTVNGYVTSAASVNGRRFTFDGTTLGLTRSALAAGAQIGDVVRADYGGNGRDMLDYVLQSHGGGDRTPGGVWVGRVRS